MKTQHRLLSFGKVSAALLLTAGALYAADAMVRYEAQPESKVRIDGTSTIHDWTVQGTIIGGFVEADPTFAKAPGTVSKMNPKVEVTIPVRSLKSDQAKAMDNVMYEAMKQKEFPKIEYRLKIGRVFADNTFHVSNLPIPSREEQQGGFWPSTAN